MNDVQPEEAQPAAHQSDDAGSLPDDSTAPGKPITSFRALRIWPAGLILITLWSLKLLLPYADPSMPVMMAWFLSPLACAGLILFWWLFLSRASIREKVFGALGLVSIVFVTILLADKSMRIAGTMLHVMPWGITGFTVTLFCLARRLSISRTWIALLVALVSFGYWDLVRLDKVWGDMRTSRSWRWEPTAEEIFLAGAATRSQSQPETTTIAEPALAEPEWPEFRGPHRNATQPGLVLAEDWSVQPPREIWRVRVGPGWSSFSVAGTRLFTQEQRGEIEVVVCYDANSGAERRVHQETTRFWEAMGGAGPRATPTLADGKLFAQGATGLLCRLDPLTGKQIWQQDINTLADRTPPTWGYASSPLVTNGVVLTYAGGPGELGLLAFDVESGDLRWTSPTGNDSYSSPQLASIDGKQCVLMLTNAGITFVDPADGKLLGKHDWKSDGYRVLQPLVWEGSSVLMGTALGVGTRRLELRWDGAQFATETSWTSRRMNPDFNDGVAHKGYLYGFDDKIFACIDLATGKRKWKRGRYGNGQVLLLPSADQLLVLSETGELVLLRTNPDKLDELTRHRVLEGRTWNHPVLIGNRLYVRNSEEAACFEVTLVQPQAG